MTQREWNLADLIEIVAAARPDDEAVVCGPRRETYRSLNARTTRLASYLQGCGVGIGDRVALYLTNCPEYLEAVFAAAKLRAASVNVNYRYVAHELTYLLADSGARALIFHASLAPVVHEVAASLPALEVLIEVEDGAVSAGAGRVPGAIAYEEALAGAASDVEFERPSGDDLYLLYTGGTTGMPKGVMWHQQDLILGGLLPSGITPMSRPEDLPEVLGQPPIRRLAAPPLMHGTGQWVALATLFAGGTVVLNADRRFEARAVWELVAAERVELVSIVGDAMGRPLAEALATGESGLDLFSCRLLLSSGAVLSPPIKAALVAALPHLRILDTYGASETGVQARSVGEAGDQPRFAVGADTAVLGDDLRPVEPGSGTIGRLARSGHVAYGYYKDPEKTRATFPVVDGVRWSVSGDHAVVEDDGTITPLGRGAVCINTGGEKVYPEEVEIALKSHGQVRDALVVGVPDERFGERVVALIEPQPGEPLDADDVVAHVRRILAGYKAPRRVLLVDSIRRSDAGKPDYQWGRAVARVGADDA